MDDVQTVLSGSIGQAVQNARETVWINPLKGRPSAAAAPLTQSDIDDAEARLERFAPLIRRLFPETEEAGGLIESPLVPLDGMKRRLEGDLGAELKGRLFLKMDSDLAVAGSVKARGGIYEVLHHAEDLAISEGLLRPGEPYDRLAGAEARDFFRRYSIEVGSTGNLGLSIGIMGTALGFRVTVHMSADAKPWKKDLLRRHGAAVREYRYDYSEAVRQGRAHSLADPRSYFVDDENSVDLFLGYATAAGRLARQLAEQGVAVDEDHPLFVYIPCGVGGAPGGITFGLSRFFGGNVHCFFAEPVQAPCMLLGMLTGLHERICVQDAGLTGRTRADGLAVGRPSGFVGRQMEPLLAGIFTVDDSRLFEYLRSLRESEGIYIEPSSCAAFQGPARLGVCPETREYIQSSGLRDKMPRATHIVWATGGRLVPPEERERDLQTGL